jgi:putative ABC transport system substrate-binding protein
MKRIGRISMRYLWMLCVVLIVSSIGCSKEQNNEHNKNGANPKIYVITPLTHPSLEASIAGFKQGLSENGHPLNKVDIEYSNANGDSSKIAALVKIAIEAKPALIFVVTTPAATEAIKLTNAANIPLVYTAVTDPLSAKIVTAMQKSETLATGVSDKYPVEEQVKFFLKIMPGMRKAGIMYNPAEQNSLILVKETETELKAQNVAVNRYEVHNAGEIPIETKRLLAANDSVIVNGDNLVMENLTAVINACLQAKKPLFVGDPDSVKKGAVATVGPSYFDIGVRAGAKAAQILDGKNAKEIPSEYPTAFNYIINTKAAELMGVKIPSDFWNQRQIWESKTSTTN